MENNLEQLKLELNCRLEEYRALRAEIVSTLTSAYQTTNLTLVAIGVSISGSKFIEKNPILLIAASLVFHTLLWIQLRYDYVVLNMSNHIIDTVTPAIRKLLEDISPRDNLTTVLTWESSGRADNHSKDKSFLFIEGARYGLPLLSAILMSFVYVYLNINNNRFGCFGVSLFVFSLLLIGYSVHMTFKVREMLKGSKFKEERKQKYNL